MRRIGIIVSLALLLFGWGCTDGGNIIYMPDPNEEQPSTAPIVTVIYDANALGDRSYNDLIYAGVERTAHELGLRTMQQSPETQDEGFQYLEQLFQQIETAQDTVRRLLIVTSPSYDDFIRNNNRRLEANPRADLLYLETRSPLEGKGTTLFMPYYGAMYEAGRITAATVYPSVMLVGANRQTEAVTDAVQGYQDGFEAGLQLLTERQKKRTKLATYWLDETGQGGFSIADTAALRLLWRWADDDFMEVVPVCGGASGTFARMNSMVGLSLAGIDTFFDSTYSAYSIVKHIDRAIDGCIREWLQTGSMPRHLTLGLASGYTEVILNCPVPIWEPEGYEGTTVPTLTDEMRQAIHDEAIQKEEDRDYWLEVRG